MTRHDPTPPDTSPENALDQALDALLQDDPTALDALDPMMRATVARLYDLADLAGPETLAALTDDAARASADARPSRPLAPVTTLPVERPAPSRRRSPRRFIMPTLSGLAAALILGLGIYGAIPIFNDADPAGPTQIAFQAVDDSTPTTIAADDPLVFTGGDPLVNANGSTYLPPVGTELTGLDGEDALNPISPDECMIAPRTRDEVVTILSTPPAAGDDAPMVGDESTIDDATLTEIQATFREWQACVRFGATWQATALETDQYIRTDFYDDGPVLTSIYDLIDVPYSEETINGILDGRISLDEQKAALGAQLATNPDGSEGGLDLKLWVIDLTPPANDDTKPVYVSSNGGTYLTFSVVLTQPRLITDAIPTASVSFKLVDGVWQIDQWISLETLSSVGL